MKTIALLPMKAHSERVPGKNFKRLAGKPLFQWILESLLAVEAIDQIVINTDARILLEQQGLTECERVIIRERKEHLCGDHVSMNLIIQDDEFDSSRSLFDDLLPTMLSSKTMSCSCCV